MAAWQNPTSSWQGTAAAGPADTMKSEFMKQYFRREAKEHINTWQEWGGNAAEEAREERRRMSRYSTLSRSRQFSGRVSPRRSKSPRRVPRMPGPPLGSELAPSVRFEGHRLSFDKTPAPDRRHRAGLVFDEGAIKMQSTRGLGTLNASRLGPTANAGMATMNDQMYTMAGDAASRLRSDPALEALYRKGVRYPGSELSQYLDEAIRKDIDLKSTAH